MRPAAGHAVPVEVASGSGRIGILGPIELVGEEPVPLGGVKERCLLAALAVHCGQAVSTGCLVDALGRMIRPGRPRRRCRTMCFVFAARWPGRAGRSS